MRALRHPVRMVASLGVVCCLQGCIAIPIPAPVKASHPWVKGGSPEWTFARSIDNGRTTRSEVAAALGQPTRSSGERFATYEAHTEAGRLVGFASIGVASGYLYEKMGYRHLLLLEYDTAGVVARHDLQRFFLFWDQLDSTATAYAELEWQAAGTLGAGAPP